MELFHDYLRDGRIKLRDKIKVPVTIQDPCNVVRSGGLAEKNRHLAEMLSEDFRPPKYQGNYNYCCGGGGGAMPMGGEIVAANATLSDTPEMVNGDPYGTGWMIHIRPSDPAFLETLMTREAYLDMLKG